MYSTLVRSLTKSLYTNHKYIAIDQSRLTMPPAFQSDPDATKESTKNAQMMHRLVTTISTLCPNFKSFIYPGGTRGYGIYRPGGIFTAPLTESMADDLPPDYAATVAYPRYRALLASLSENCTRWSWTELCPDAIIGFTPNGSGFSLAAHWAVYLYTWKLVHGEGAEIPFPGTMEGWTSLYSETSARTLARVALFAAMNPRKLLGEIVNVADRCAPSCMRERWPQIAAWFGLKGVGPREGASVDDERPGLFVRKHRDYVLRTGVREIEVWNAGQLDSYGYWLTFDRQLSLEKLRAAGFEEERPPQEGWWEAFELFRLAGMIQ